MKQKLFGFILSIVLVCSIILFTIPHARALATTLVTVTKLANDGTTILDQVNVTVQEMMDGSPELPIYGDGVTHYYCQGPTFDENNLWDSGIPPEPSPGETVNVDSRDYGAAKGNDVKDLCEMLPSGGASPGDVIRIKSPDGFSKLFDYEDVYEPEPEQGKMIITWYTKDAVDGLSGERYVTDGSYNTGMRLLFFTETLSPEGKHVFGLWDMHETLAESRWHYYYDGTFWPSSSGLSVKWVSDIIIYSSEEPPEGAHDVGVIDVTNSKDEGKPMPTVPDNSIVKINVTVANNGNFTETFNLTLFGNSTVIDTQTVTALASGTQTTHYYAWDISGWSHGNYTLSAYAVPVAGEANTADNTYTNGIIRVVIPGDINGDGFVDIYDAILLANAYNAMLGMPNWNPNADLKADEMIDIYDAIILANHYNQHE